MTLFANTYYHLPICWMICVILFVRLSFSYRLWRRAIPYITYLILTMGTRWVWPVSRGCILLQGTRSYHHICQESVLPCSLFCICSLGFDYVYQIVNFVILYFVLRSWPLKTKSFHERSIFPILFHLCSIKKKKKTIARTIAKHESFKYLLSKTRHWINSPGCI
jgi:hypothetical protein